MAGTILTDNMLHIIGGEGTMEKRDPQLLEAIRSHLVCVILNQEVGNFESADEDINVLIVEGDQKEGIGVVMSEPMVIEPQPSVFCGDLAEWVPGPGGIGRITKIATPDFETL